MKKSMKFLLLIITYTIPMIVFASSSSDSGMGGFGYIWVGFETLHWTFMFFKPMSKLLAQKMNKPDKEKTIFWTMFVIRMIIYLILLQINEMFFLVDFFGLFVMAFVMGIAETAGRLRSTLAVDKNSTITTPGGVNTVSAVKSVEVLTGTITCPKCGRVMAYGNTRCVVCGTDLKKVSYVCSQCHTENEPTAKFCKSCGAQMIVSTVTASQIPKCPKCGSELVPNAKFCRMCGENVEAIWKKFQPAPTIPRASEGTKFDANGYAASLMYGSLESSIGDVVAAELAKDPNYKGKTLAGIETRKTILTVIYAIITFILVSLFAFFHTYAGLDILLWVVATIIFLVMNSKYNLKKYLCKEVEKRPSEKISNIVASTLSGSTTSKSLFLMVRLAVLVICFFFIFAFYSKPHYIYEQQDGGYVLRYYTFGLLENEKTIVIPDNYNNKPVIGIRGDTFKNVITIEEVSLPDTILEIRGGAFEGCASLRKINIPKHLTEISGSTFKDCIALESITIPEGVTRIGGGAFQNDRALREVTIPSTVTEIGGEAFMGCIYLSKVELPPHITEVHGSTFEDCSSLESIVIPEGVTRIGGSAFRNCVRLSAATIPKSVTEIGSSAFRNTALTKVCISKNAFVNERAFKETYPTIGYYENNCEASTDYYGDYTDDYDSGY